MSSHHANTGTVLLGLAFLTVAAVHVRGDEAHQNLSSDARMARVMDGCSDIPTITRAIQLLLSHDPIAYNEYLRPRIELGICRAIEAGTRIAIERREPISPELNSDGSLGNWYCVRPYGDPTCYWTLGSDIFGKPL